MCRLGECGKCVAAAMFAVAMFCLSVGCDKFGGTGGAVGKGFLSVRFLDETLPEVRTVTESIDTNAFIVTLENEYGEKVYDGLYGNMPERFELDAGTYMVRAVSCEFARPVFSRPQFGDEKCVLVSEGGCVSTVLCCRQMNAGVKLEIDVSFLENYPTSSLVLRSKDGSLSYSYREKRYAYFRPGEISLVLVSGSEEKKLMARNMKASEMLLLSVSASGSSEVPEEGLRLCVDTARVWHADEYIIGGGGSEGDGSGSGTTENMMTVAEAIKSVGMSGVWVNGFIVGGDLTQTSGRDTPPFRSATNLLLAPRAGKCSRESCIAVSLPAGKVREALNLVDNPHLLGRQVSLKGDIVEKYFGITGMKNISSFQNVK